VVVRERGHAHAKAFLVAAEIGKRRFPSAWGRTLKEAERWAAHEALLVLEEEA
jgi:dsRNA-specific ribonuclease